jgi:hypothetical protein
MIKQQLHIGIDALCSMYYEDSVLFIMEKLYPPGKV